MAVAAPEERHGSARAWVAAAVVGAAATVAAALLGAASGDDGFQVATVAVTGLALGGGGAALVALDRRSLTGRILGWCGVLYGAVQLAGAVGSRQGPEVRDAVARVESWTWPLFVVPLLTLLPQAFPARHFLPGWWRAGVWAAVAAVVLLCVGEAADLPAVVAAGTTAWAAGGLTGLACLAIRWRRGSPVDRARMELVGCTLGLVVVAYLVDPLLPPVANQVIGSLTPALLVGSIAVAALRRGLWSEELVIRRAQASTVLTALLGVSYLLALGGIAQALGDLPGWAAALGAALVTVAVLEPARRAARRLVEHRLFGDRGEPLRALTRLREATSSADELAAASQVVVAEVARSVRAPGARLLVHGPAGLYPTARVGELGSRPLRLPLVHLAEEVGALEVARRDGEEWSDADQVLLRHLADEAATTVSVLRTRLELEVARHEQLESAAEQRAELGRDLHDVLGPVLAGTYLAAEGLSRRLEDDDAEEARRIARDVKQATAEVRRMIDGLAGPSSLDGRTLAEVVRDHADLLSRHDGPVVEVDVDAGDVPPDVATVAHLVIGEALTNVVRHSAARSASVVVRRCGGALDVVVRDDGRGPGTFVAGVGLRSMRIRSAGLGGSCVVRPLDPGTEVHAVLPLTGARA